MINLESWEALLVVAYAVVPGATGLSAFNWACVRQVQEVSRFVLSAVGVSMAFWVLMAPAVWFVVGRGYQHSHPIVVLGAATWLALFLPALHGTVLGVLLNRYPDLPAKFGLRPIAPTAWDWAFADRGTRFVRVHLADGGMIAGWWGDRSQATRHPLPPALFIEQEWTVTDDGTIKDPVPDSAGIWIDNSMIRVVEFIQPMETSDDKASPKA